MSISIDNVSKISGIAIALVAVVTFVISVMDNREERRDARISSWRKVAIQEALQDAQSNKLKITEILTKLRELAWETPDLDIQKEELSKEKIRELLLEMIASGIVEQNKDDIYYLRFAQKTTNLEAIFVDKYERAENFKRELLEKLSRMPGHYSMEEIFEEIASPLDFDRIDYNATMGAFQQLGVIEIDEDRRVRLKDTMGG